MKQDDIFVIVGPTAVGKTQLALELADILHGEIVSADSMQVYKGMNIGTAKPNKQEQTRVKHHLIDVVDPDQPFNVADYVNLAEQAMAQIVSRNRTPILTGGTGLYVNALIDGFLFPDTKADLELRNKLQAQADKEPESLFQRLQEVDPTSAAKLHPNDHRRIIRALEVFYRTGEPISELQKKAAQEERPYRPLFIGLTRDRGELYERVNHRVDLMIQEGLVDEVQSLMEKYPHQPTALQALGYKEIVSALNGDVTLQEAVELLKRDTRRYAKRQLSWFKRDKRINWLNLSGLDYLEAKQSIIAMWEAFTD